MVDSTASVSSPSSRYGSTRIYGLRKALVGELNVRAMRWLDKVLMVDSTVSVSSPSMWYGAKHAAKAVCETRCAGCV
eukprot:6838409-Pyramimonas_sp.AAC.1